MLSIVLLAIIILLAAVIGKGVAELGFICGIVHQSILVLLLLLLLLKLAMRVRYCAATAFFFFGV